MNHSRREFLKKSGLTMASAATVTVLPTSLFASAKKKEILSIQLYSVRDDMKKDPSGSLGQIAAMGYKNVEHANYVDGKFYGYAPKEFKKVLDGLGLKMLSGHTVMGTEAWDANKKEFTDVWKKTVEDAAFMGQEYVISPWFDEQLRKTYDGMLQFLDVFNHCGKLCQQHGMKFGYHNHDFEFTEKLNGQNVFDIIMKNTDPKMVTLQLDMGNMFHTGARGQDILKKYPGRFDSVHVKDEIKNAQGKYESTILGKGEVGTKEVTDLAKKIGGTSLFVVEQESYQQKTPMEAAKEDYAVMKKWGY